MFRTIFNSSLNKLTWSRRLKILSMQGSSPAFVSTTAAKFQGLKVELDTNLEEKIAANELKPRKHFGVNKASANDIPERIVSSMIKCAGDFPIKTLVASGEQFDRYLKGRKAPMEAVNLKRKMREIEEMVLSDPAKYKIPPFPQEGAPDYQMKMFHDRKNQRVQQILNYQVYGWQAINYDEHKSLVYLMGRSAKEYSVIMRIFREISKRDPDFKPRAYFDFGAGVGTGIWAAAAMWESSIFEYYLVDSSKHMNDLSDLILRDGNVNKAMWLKNVYQRQFLPSRDDKYDVVLSAYSFFELPNLKTRLEVATNLWNKAGKYLIFIENGTNAGFQMINEIRDFLMTIKESKQENAFVFSPCPHESPCPRFALNDGTPCNFEIVYNTLPFSGPSEYRKDTYSYLVIKKGEPTEADRWPRIVRSTLLRHKHVICRMCTKEGKLQEGIFTKAKHGKLPYKIAKSSSWGDQLPVKILDHESDGESESSDE